MMTRVRDLVVRLALLLALLLPAYFAFAALGTKFGLIDWRVGFVTMTYRWGTTVIYVALAVGITALLVSLVTVPRRGIVTALIAVLIPIIAMGYGYYGRSKSGGVPPIHDVSTDALNPPELGAAVMALRAAENANEVVPPTRPMKERSYFQRIAAAFPERAGAIADQSVADIVAHAYPDIEPIELPIPAMRAFELAQSEARAQGWKIQWADVRRGLLNATAETFWFGFKDDVAIRVEAGAGSDTSVVDVRSISRVGGGDMGTNARRIRDFREGLKRRASQRSEA